MGDCGGVVGFDTGATRRPRGTGTLCPRLDARDTRCSPAPPEATSVQQFDESENYRNEIENVPMPMPTHAQIWIVIPDCRVVPALLQARCYDQVRARTSAGAGNKIGGLRRRTKAYPKMVGSHPMFGIASGNKSYPTAVP